MEFAQVFNKIQKYFHLASSCSVVVFLNSFLIQWSISNRRRRHISRLILIKKSSSFLSKNPMCFSSHLPFPYDIVFMWITLGSFKSYSWLADLIPSISEMYGRVAEVSNAKTCLFFCSIPLHLLVAYRKVALGFSFFFSFLTWNA